MMWVQRNGLKLHSGQPTGNGRFGSRCRDTGNGRQGRVEHDGHLQLFRVARHSLVRRVDLHSASSTGFGTTLHLPNGHIVAQYKGRPGTRVLRLTLDLLNVQCLPVVLLVLHRDRGHASSVFRREYESLDGGHLLSQQVEFQGKLCVLTSSRVSAVQLETLCGIHQRFDGTTARVRVRTLELQQALKTLVNASCTVSRGSQVAVTELNISDKIKLTARVRVR